MGIKLAYLFDQPLPLRAAECEQLINTISALSKIDYDITLFIPGDRTKPAPTLQELQSFYRVDGNFRVEAIYSVFPAQRLIEKTVHPLMCSTLLRKKLRGFDLVYTRNIPSIFASLAAGVPCLYDTYRPWPAQYYHALVPMFRAFFKHPKFMGIALHSEYARQSYIDFGMPEDKLLTAHNGFNPDLFKPVLSQSEAKAKAGIESEQPLALYAGRMDPEKGIGSLIDLAEQTPECNFIFIGSHGHGPLEERMDKLPNVQYTGWVSPDELTQFYYAADILMLPLTTLMYKKNGNTVLPIKLYSYFAAGRAIFAASAPDVTELLKDGENARLVPQGDAEAAIEKFHELVHSQELRDHLAEGARISSMSLTWDARAELLDGFIRRRLEAISK
ncbi:MAG: glycosyltransferase [Proteobacteria bacterium]|nr:glycosyltransferase [Pseudomonadota bacterium]